MNESKDIGQMSCSRDKKNYLLHELSLAVGMCKTEGQHMQNKRDTQLNGYV